MFKSLSLMSAAVLAAASLASPAAAQHLSPAPGVVTISGTLVLQQSTTLTCTGTFTVSIDAAGVGTITGGTFSPPSSPLCGALIRPSNFPWTVTATALDEVTITGIGATSILGSCAGDVEADVAGGTITFSNEVIPGTPSNCTIVSGILSGPFSIVP